MPVTIKVDPGHKPGAKTFPLLKVNDNSQSMHTYGQVSLQNATDITIDFGSGSSVTMVQNSPDTFTLKFT
jgi:hypothetical protein